MEFRHFEEIPQKRNSVEITEFCQTKLYGIPPELYRIPWQIAREFCEKNSDRIPLDTLIGKQMYSNIIIEYYYRGSRAKIWIVDIK